MYSAVNVCLFICMVGHTSWAACNVVEIKIYEFECVERGSWLVAHGLHSPISLNALCGSSVKLEKKKKRRKKNEMKIYLFGYS